MRALTRYVDGARGGLRSLAQVVDGTYRWVFATEFAVLIILLGVLKLAAGVLNAQEFGAFMLLRTALTLAYPVVLLGLGVALPRYLSIAAAREDRAGLDRLWTGALVVWMIAAVVTAVLFATVRNQTATLLLGSPRHAELTPYLGLMLVGFSWHALVYGYFRGRLLMGRANMLQVLNTAVVPAVSLAITQDLPAYFLVAAIGWLLVPSVVLAASRVSFRVRGAGREARTLLAYGVRRLPGDFFLVGLLSIPVILVSSVAGAVQAAYVSLGMTIVGLLGAALTPLGIVLLPRSTRAFARAEDEDLRREVKTLMMAVTAAGVLFLPLAFLLAEPALVAFLGDRFSEAGSVVPLVLVAAWPYAYFVVLRNVLDARHRRAVNSRNGAVALATLAVFGTAGLLAENVNTILLGFDTAMLVLGVLTVFEVRAVFRSPGSRLDGEPA